MSEGQAGTSGTAAADEAAPLDLHADLYLPEAVERAVSAFEAVATCTVERNGAYLRVRLKALGGRDPALLRQHLANWALAASVAPRS